MGLAKTRHTAARLAFVAWYTHKNTKVEGDPTAASNPDRQDDFVDLIADLLILANDLGLDGAYIARVGAAHVPHAAEDARAHDLAAEKPLSEVERLGLTTTPPTWESGDLRAWRDRIGGIAIHHAGDGSEAYLQPGDEANGLAATLDQIDSHANFGPAAKAAKYDALAEYLPPGSLD